jgi:hypothetical protein
MRHFLRRALKLGGVVALSTGLVAFAATAASATLQAPNPSQAVVVSPGTANPLNSGAATTAYGLQLNTNLAPAGCVHGSANSAVALGFMVPTNTTAAALQSMSVTGGVPFPTGAYNSFGLAANGSNAVWPGVNPTGLNNTNFTIAGLPSFLFGPFFSAANANISGTGNFSLIDQSQPNPGKWFVGIGCFYQDAASGLQDDVGDNIWYVECDFTDIPSHANVVESFSWTCLNPGVVGANVPETPLAIGLPAGGAAVLAGAVYINRRRHIGRRKEVVTSA